MSMGSRAFLAGRRIAARAGLDVVRRTYYSPIPRTEGLDPDYWTTPRPLPGIDLGLERQQQLVEQQLRSYLDEFAERLAQGQISFDPRNRMYGVGDADTLYAMVRSTRPRCILELGVGHSTLVLLKALEANRLGGFATELISNDPFPPAFLDGHGVRRRAATDIPIAEFLQLGSGDVLFVDTTHTVKVNGDVNYVVLEVLPQLRPGVIVHFHDIFLPFEYPRDWVEDKGRYWAEQYLLQAFLCQNPKWEVVLACQALTRDQGLPAVTSLPELFPSASPGAFWIRRGEG
jgi:hypothetical protein